MPLFSSVVTKAMWHIISCIIYADVGDDFPEIHEGYSVDDVAQDVLKLHSLALKLRAKRYKNGAVWKYTVRVLYNLLWLYQPVI